MLALSSDQSCVCRVTFKISPNPSKKQLKKPKKSPPRGPGGGRGQKCFYPNFYYFFLGAHAKFGNPTTTLSGRTVMAVERRGEKREKKREKFPLTPMGVLAPVSAQRDTPLSPPSTSAEIFRRTCLQSSLKKNLKNPGGGGGKIFKIFF